jgi:hypothetical protein
MIGLLGFCGGLSDAPHSVLTSWRGHQELHTKHPCGAELLGLGRRNQGNSCQSHLERLCPASLTSKHMIVLMFKLNRFYMSW